MRIPSNPSSPSSSRLALIAKLGRVECLCIRPRLWRSSPGRRLWRPPPARSPWADWARHRQCHNAPTASVSDRPCTPAARTLQAPRTGCGARMLTDDEGQGAWGAPVRAGVGLRSSADHAGRPPDQRAAVAVYGAAVNPGRWRSRPRGPRRGLVLQSMRPYRGSRPCALGARSCCQR